MKKINENVLKIGDIVLTSSNQKISKVIRSATKSDISHAMICVQYSGIIEATSRGVRGYNAQRLFYADNCPIYILRLIKPISDKDMRNVIDHVRQREGTEYSQNEALLAWRGGSKKLSKKQFCSRLIAQAYASVGVNLVETPNYCTPQDLKASKLLKSLPHSTRLCSDGEFDFINNSFNTLQVMEKVTNILLLSARKISRSIQSVSDLSIFLLKNPAFDNVIAQIYIDSGYLFAWVIEFVLNDWQYDLKKMSESDICFSEKKQYCENIVAGLLEDIRRYKWNLSLYKKYVESYQLKTFVILEELYTKLVELHLQRVDTAREWLKVNN